MKVLFIGGTGVISTACAALAVSQGIELTLLNRGKSMRPAAEGAKLLQADIHDPGSAAGALEGRAFDAVVDWIAYTPQDVQRDLDLFAGKTGQFVFISSASAYQTPPASLPIRESTVLDNPFWEYSRNKIACEDLLVKAYRASHFPYTIVRPSHTYDQTLVPLMGSFTALERMLKGLPVIVPGDGTSIWTLTHSADFAVGFTGLLGNPHAVGEVFQITSDEWLTWNQIYLALAAAGGVTPDLVHIPSDLLAAYDPDLGAGLLGDKSNSAIFDNSKIKQVVAGFAAKIPFRRGAEQILAWHYAHPGYHQADAHFNDLTERVLAGYRKAWPENQAGKQA